MYMNFFMITPHKSDPLFGEKRHIVERVSKQYGVNVYYSSGYPIYSESDLRKNIQFLKSTDFCVADLSFERPSCYFETGFVQSMGRSDDLIALVGTTIHQVLN